MPTVHFIGRIFPDIYKVTIDKNITGKWESPESNLIMEFSNTIIDSKINLECKLNRYNDNDLAAIYKCAFDLCRTSVNIVGFSMGCGFTVLIDSFIDPENNEFPISFKNKNLQSICTAFNLKEGFDEIHKMVLTDWALAGALNDIIESITQIHVSPINCARAIERLKHLISPNIKDESKAWNQMRTLLNIDEKYLKFITDHSTNPRHGKPLFIPGSITTDITFRAWTILNRFFEFRKKGSQPLPINEFPLLK